MKTTKDDALYVEREDIKYLKYVPNEVLIELKSDKNIDSDLVEFNTKRSIEYFMGLEEILDYNYVSRLSPELLAKKISEIDKELNKFSKEWVEAGSIYRTYLAKDERRKEKLRKLRLKRKTLDNYKLNKDKYDSLFNKNDNYKVYSMAL